MRRARLLLFPITLVWTAGAVWWVSRHNACGCGGAATVQASTAPAAPAITLGPTTSTTTDAATQAASLDPTQGSEPLLHPVLLQPWVIPFVKNRPEVVAGDEMESHARALKTYLEEHQEASVVVTGHTDADGDAELNRRLSAERAEAVKAQLAGLGVPADRITVVGMGADQPVSDNLTSKGKALNRRVVVALEPLP